MKVSIVNLYIYLPVDEVGKESIRREPTTSTYL